MHGKDDTAVITIQEFPVVGAIAQTRTFEILFLKSLLSSRLCHGIALFKRIAQLKLADDVVTQAAPAKITHADSHAVNVVVQRIYEIIARPLVDNEHSLAG